MSEARQGFPDDRDRKIMRNAERLSQRADDLVSWAGEHLSERAKTEFAIDPEEEFDLYKMRREASNLCRASNVPVAAAVYGASQVGKSLFIGRVMTPAEELDSPLGKNDEPPGYVKELSFEHDINPQSGSNEATALVTRFTTKERFDENALPEYPVKVRALTRSEWLRVVARGFRSECLQPKGRVWLEGQIRSLLEEIAGRHGGTEINRDWRIDLLDTYAYLRDMDVNQYAAAESIFNALLSQYPLTNDGYAELAGRLFWDSKNFPSLTSLFQQVNQFIEKVTQAGRDGILVHWGAVKFLLDSQRAEIQESPYSRWKQSISWSDFTAKVEDGWYVIDYSPDAGGPADDLWVIQSAMLELIVPVIPHRLNSDWAEVVHKMDLLDLPGMKAGGGDSQSGAKKIETVAEKMNVVKRGKVFYLIDRYLEERQVQTLFLLVRGGGSDVRQLLKQYVDKWGQARYGFERWPRKVDSTDPALFIGMTGIDSEFSNNKVDRNLYFNRLNMLVSEMLYEVMTDFGGEGKPFTNVFPIRYPGSWDFNEAKRARLGEDASKWDEARARFIGTKIVQKHVENPELKWDVAMRDNDGGLSLICKGFIRCTTSEQKQDALQKRIETLSKSLKALADRWYCDPNANHDRQKRLDSAEQMLGWLAEPRQVYDRVHALHSALCFDEGDAMQIAEFADRREPHRSGRPETVSERFPGFLQSEIQQWARKSAVDVWEQQLAKQEASDEWPSVDQFGTFVGYLADYICGDEAFNPLKEKLLQIVTLPIRDAGDRRFALRAYIRVILNDFVLNPGPTASVETNNIDQSEDESVEVEVAESSDDVDSEPEPDFGLMAPFLDRWNQRLPNALASVAGEHVEIPSGNDQLHRLIEKF